MFDQLKTADQAEHLAQVFGNYQEGVDLYKAFQAACNAQDKVRAPRLAIRLDAWHNSLQPAQREEFAALLVHDGIIPKDSTLGKAILTFNASFKCFA